MMQGRSQAVAFIIAGLLTTAAIAPAQQPKHRTSGRGSQEVRRCPPTLDMRRLMVLLRNYLGGTFSKTETSWYFENCPISVIQTQETIDALSANKADDFFLSAFRKVAPKPPPPPPKPAASLSLFCGPPECEIRINGTVAGTTHDGQLRREGFFAGDDVTIEFSRTGYESEKDTHRMLAGNNAVSATLRPDPSTRKEYGKNLLDSMLQALGVRQSAPWFPSLTSIGSIVIETDGASRTWNLNLELVEPAVVQMDIGLKKGPSLGFVCSGDECTEKKRGRLLGIIGRKEKPDPLRQELQMAATTFARYNLAAVLKRLRAPAVEFSAKSLSADTKGSYALGSVDDRWSILLDSGYVPVMIEYRDRGGDSAGIVITYGEYVPVGPMKYPRLTSISLPASAKRVIKVQVPTVELGPNHRADSL